MLSRKVPSLGPSVEINQGGSRVVSRPFKTGVSRDMRFIWACRDGKSLTKQ